MYYLCITLYLIKRVTITSTNWAYVLYIAYTKLLKNVVADFMWKIILEFKCTYPQSITDYSISWFGIYCANLINVIL